MKWSSQTGQYALEPHTEHQYQPLYDEHPNGMSQMCISYHPLVLPHWVACYVWLMPRRSTLWPASSAYWEFPSCIQNKFCYSLWTRSYLLAMALYYIPSLHSTKLWLLWWLWMKRDGRGNGHSLLEVPVLAYICEVICSNLGYHDQDLLYFSSVPPSKCWNSTLKGPYTLLSTLLPTNLITK